MASRRSFILRCIIETTRLEHILLSTALLLEKYVT
jgi:hypothetical protein